VRCVVCCVLSMNTFMPFSMPPGRNKKAFLGLQQAYLGHHHRSLGA
jgi:hypothetical protein